MELRTSGIGNTWNTWHSWIAIVKYFFKNKIPKFHFVYNELLLCFQHLLVKMLNGMLVKLQNKSDKVNQSRSLKSTEAEFKRLLIVLYHFMAPINQTK